MANEIEYEKVETYRVAGVLFTYVSSWNGIEEWRDGQGRKLLVMRERNLGFADAFGRIFGAGAETSKRQLQVIACSADLVQLLREKTGLGQVQAGEAVVPGKA